MFFRMPCDILLFYIVTCVALQFVLVFQMSLLDEQEQDLRIELMKSQIVESRVSAEALHQQINRDTIKILITGVTAFAATLAAGAGLMALVAHLLKWW
jgi:Na+-transporting methylmalonyl-CoA/oxaloacetate decarboxylase beta subunit